MGDSVLIKNLVKAADYNGLIGVVESEVENGRHAVKLESGKVVAIKPENLEMVQEDKMDDGSIEEKSNGK